MGVELSGRALAARLAVAILASAVSLLLFYYVPSNITQLVRATGVSSSFVPPELPALGLAIAAFVFLGFLLRGTGAYGVILVLLGLLFAVYVYLFFGGGTVVIEVQPVSASGASGAIAVNASTLMYILLVAPLLTVVKGLFILATQREERAAGGVS